jgi:hypothetical protein
LCFNALPRNKRPFVTSNVADTDCSPRHRITDQPQVEQAAAIENSAAATQQHFSSLACTKSPDRGDKAIQFLLPAALVCAPISCLCTKYPEITCGS